FIFLFSLCISSAVLADRTYLTLISESETQIFSGNVDVYVETATRSGNLSGCFSGTYFVTSNWLAITSGDYAGYGFGFGSWTAEINGQLYEGYWVEAKKPGESGHSAIDGDIRGIMHEGTGELASFLGTQYSGTFYSTETGREETQFSASVLLKVYSNTSSFSLSGYYSGTTTVTGFTFVFDVSNLEPFQEWDIDELVSFIGTYDWSETNSGTDGEAYLVGPLGSITGALKGVYYNGEELEIEYIEHVGTAPPIPIPSTVFLLGSGLIGLGLSRKRFLRKK
ncbi:MAG: hypothetical protein LWW95_07050, partial [Candidatus Desulfofervidus auxilii]|nr:hypothetical protein [Candidatus Desulfofervidus auxilii]